jgi:uncharacterized membrane protein YphA (DoxX/SURF4 family)
MSLIATVLCVVLAVVFTVAGLNKFSGSDVAEAAPAHLNISTGFYRLAGVLELLGSIGLVVGVLAAPALAGVAAACLASLLVGAVVLHIRVGDSFGLGQFGDSAEGGVPGLESWAPAAGLVVLSALTAALVFTSA